MSTDRTDWADDLDKIEEVDESKELIVRDPTVTEGLEQKRAEVGDVIGARVPDPSGEPDGRVTQTEDGSLRHLPLTRYHSLDATPITGMEVDVGGPRPLEVFDEKLWAQDGEDIVSSEDGGESWSVEGPAPSGETLRGLLPTSDGEMLAQTSQRIFKSDGWPDSPSWTEVWSNPESENSNARRWSFDGEPQGSKFIVTHYSASDREYSWGAWISTDAGDTWNLKWDSREQHNDNENTHPHGVAYDWWEDRFFFIEGHGPERGIFYSDDDGENWTKLGGWNPSPQGTTITPTDKGIVVALDSPSELDEPNGMAVIRRRDDPADMELELAYRWRQNSGFGDTAKRDPETGLVYVGWRTGDYPRTHEEWSTPADTAGRPPWIACSDGNTATLVYEHPLEDQDWGRGDRFRDVIPDSRNGRVIGRFDFQGSIVHFRATLNPPGSLPATWPDNHAGAYGGYAGSSDSMALGVGAVVPAARRVTSVGAQASVPGTETRADVVAVGHGVLGDSSRIVVIGSQARATEQESVLVGFSASAGARDVVLVGNDATAGGDARWAVALGHEADVDGEGSIAIGGRNVAVSAGAVVAIGRDISVQDSSVVAIGRNVTAGEEGQDGREVVAIGRNASARRRYSVAIGMDAEASGGQGGVALGRDARADGTGSLAVGMGARAEATRRVAIGQDAAAGPFGTAFGASSKSDAATGGTALGREAVAAHDEGTAIGRDAATSAANQVALGPRHIELGAASDPGNAGAGKGRLFFEDDGGTMKLMARFPSGAAVEIAAEPST